jgi:hypothetical protein
VLGVTVKEEIDEAVAFPKTTAPKFVKVPLFVKFPAIYVAPDVVLVLAFRYSPDVIVRSPVTIKL